MLLKIIQIAKITTNILLVTLLSDYAAFQTIKSNNQNFDEYAFRSTHSILLSPSTNHSTNHNYNQVSRASFSLWSPHSDFSANQVAIQNNSQPFSPPPNHTNNQSPVTKTISLTPFKDLTSQLNNFALLTPPRTKSSISVTKKIWSISDFI